MAGFDLFGVKAKREAELATARAAELQSEAAVERARAQRQLVQDTSEARRAWQALENNHLTSKLRSRETMMTGRELERGFSARAARTARALTRSSPIAARIKDFRVDRVVGEGGFLPKWKTKSPELNKLLDEKFRRWAEDNDWFERLSQIVGEWAEIGNGYAEISIIDGEPALTPFEDELLDYSADSVPERTQGGIKYDAAWRPVEYYIGDVGNPYGAYQNRTVPASRVLHLFRRDRPSNLKGFPKILTCAHTIWLIEDTDHAEAASIRATSYWGLTLKPGSAEDELMFSEEGTPLNSGVSEVGATGASSTNPVMQIEKQAGGLTIWDGDVSLLDAKRPGNQYLPFSKAMLKRCFASQGVPYSAGSGDGSESSYSVERAAAMYHIRQWRQDQILTIDHVCRPLARWLASYWLGADARVAALARRDGVDLAEMQSKQAWQLEGYEWVDVEAEAKAIAAKLGAGVMTMQEAAAYFGSDLDELLDEHEEARKMFEERGLNPPEALEKIWGSFDVPGTDEETGTEEEEDVPNAAG
jgi:capsid protein